ncbi:MAG: hypothetical protein ACRDRX_03560 [Pseudonocardiaceae bacterium]
MREHDESIAKERRPLRHGAIQVAPSGLTVVARLSHLTPATVLHLQRAVGNASVVQLLDEANLMANRVIAGRSAVGALAEPVHASTDLNVQRGIVASSQGGRSVAVATLRGGSRGSAAEVMLGPVEWLFSTIGNTGAGQIGQHYINVFPMLNQPATRRLLMRIALQETRWWATQPGFPGFFGSMLTARARAGILIARAERMGLLDKGPRR